MARRWPARKFCKQLNTRFGQYGVGRHIYTGDVTIGLKGRIVFECPGIDALLLAHQALEDCVNTRFQNQFRHQVAQRWAELVYTGFFYEPHKQDLEAYLASSQAYVTGTVTLETTGGSMHAVAMDSDFIVQDPNAVYAQSCNWSPAEAEGFIKLTGQSSTTATRVREKVIMNLAGVLDHLESLVAFDTQNPPRSLDADSPIFGWIRDAFGAGL